MNPKEIALKLQSDFSALITSDNYPEEGNRCARLHAHKMLDIQASQAMRQHWLEVITELTLLNHD